MSLLNQAVQEKLTKDQSQVPNFKVKNGLILLETNGYDCYFDGNMIKLLGMAHSFQTQIQKIMSRKGELIDFVNEDDVRIQLEFNEN